ncbi:DMT family transporter [Roseicyclus mahoneyensis]|uniref:EamA domain-containing membrane protein RarD n=1 Tax=Roseicyclus mahoneyensis TaxID=164332 RepID=A0A316GMZ9_9RHOB|nr:DMT family transporter [Roseicyclus mahoneyensis]PWK62540.1 EamA domain-containing membrane protein RarD [Roseicyclus mahoneyensis]
MRYATGVWLVVTAAVLWSLQGLIFRQIEAASPWAILFWRSLGMAPVILAFVLWRGGGSIGPRLRGIGWAGVAGALGLVMAFGGAVYAFQSTTVANAVFLFAATPFLTAMLAWAVLRERVSARTWGSIALAMVGIFVMVRGGLEGGALPGNIAALCSAAGFAVFTVTLRRRGVTDPMPAVLLGAVFATFAGALATWGFGETLAVPRADALWALGMGAVTLSGGMVLYTLGSRVVPAADLTLLMTIEVMLSPLLVWVFLGETARQTTLLGGVFVMAAIVITARAGTRRSVAPA